MANWDNQNTRLEQERLDDEFDIGMVEGDAAPLDPLPAVAYKRLIDCTRRERGYVVAWTLKMDEHLRGTS